MNFVFLATHQLYFSCIVNYYILIFWQNEVMMMPFSNTFSFSVLSYRPSFSDHCWQGRVPIDLHGNFWQLLELDFLMLSYHCQNILRQGSNVIKPSDFWRRISPPSFIGNTAGMISMLLPLLQNDAGIWICLSISEWVHESVSQKPSEHHIPKTSERNFIQFWLLNADVFEFVDVLISFWDQRSRSQRENTISL